ncbi:relaxase/mobilization nuclease domain-containing protein [Variovorax humicola]|uniref:Relaxase/mobilization nuclease domain-containing protein n=1 Tax=Variovorax humicola TaxID=1769758 RepID=A0ABU8W2T2_9BURK
MQNAYDNELTEVVELRGAIASDLHGAVKEWEIQAETLTRCQKYLYSLSINPDPAQGEITREQYSDYIRRAEEALGLTEQPRAVVFHIKHGREHCHVVWSRIDAERCKAVHIAFDRDKLVQVTRAFAKEHFLDLPAGYDKSRKIDQETLYERAKQSQTGLSKADHSRQITDAWIESDSAKAFVNALAERGYILARGKRPYVVVDFYGDSHALARLIDDKTVKTRDVRAFLEKDFPEESLPTVAEAQDLIASNRKLSERNLQEEHIAAPLAAMEHAQKLRRLALDQERIALERRHGQARESLIARQRDERHAQRRAHLEHVDSAPAAFGIARAWACRISRPGNRRQRHSPRGSSI